MLKLIFLRPFERINTLVIRILLHFPCWHTCYSFLTIEVLCVIDSQSFNFIPLLSQTSTARLFLTFEVSCAIDLQTGTTWYRYYYKLPTCERILLFMHKLFYERRHISYIIYKRKKNKENGFHIIAGMTYDVWSRAVSAFMKSLVFKKHIQEALMNNPFKCLFGI